MSTTDPKDPRDPTDPKDPTGSGEAAVAEAARILEAAAVAESRTRHLGHRLVLALHDLGIAATVGPDWVSADEEAFHFAPLDHTTVQRLVVVLRELADTAPAPVRRPTPDQLGLTFTPRSLLPTTVSSLHDLGVAR